MCLIFIASSGISKLLCLPVKLNSPNPRGMIYHLMVKYKIFNEHTDTPHTYTRTYTHARARARMGDSPISLIGKSWLDNFYLSWKTHTSYCYFNNASCSSLGKSWSPDEAIACLWNSSQTLTHLQCSIVILNSYFEKCKNADILIQVSFLQKVLNQTLLLGLDRIFSDFCPVISWTLTQYKCKWQLVKL